MKIISPFVDYYDYLSTCFGKPDPKRTFVRPKYLSDKTKFTYKVYDKDLFLPRSYQTHFTFNDHKKSFLNFKWLVVLGKKYLIYYHSNTYLDSYIEYSRSSQFSIIQESEFYKIFSRDFNIFPEPYEVFQGKFEQEFLKITKEIKQPIFFIDSFNSSTRKYEVSDEVPFLAKMKFNRYMDAEELYQEIDYWIGNVLKDNPDKNPPVEVDNKHKIISNGFDLKTSFRHPIK